MAVSTCLLDAVARSPRIFLLALRSDDALTFYLRRGEPCLRYEKLATSSGEDSAYALCDAYPYVGLDGMPGGDLVEVDYVACAVIAGH